MRTLGSTDRHDSRLYADFTHLFDAPDYDYSRVGAWLFGRDMRALLDNERDDSALVTVLNLLDSEIVPNGATVIARDMGCAQS